MTIHKQFSNYHIASKVYTNQREHIRSVLNRPEIQISTKPLQVCKHISTKLGKIKNIKLTTLNNQQPINKFYKCSSYIFSSKQMYTQIKNNNQINQFNVPNIKLTTFNNQQPIKKFNKCSSYIFRLKQMYTQIKNNNQINQCH